MAALVLLTVDWLWEKTHPKQTLAPQVHFHFSVAGSLISTSGAPCISVDEYREKLEAHPLKQADASGR